MLPVLLHTIMARCLAQYQDDGEADTFPLSHVRVRCRPALQTRPVASHSRPLPSPPHRDLWFRRRRQHSSEGRVPGRGEWGDRRGAADGGPTTGARPAHGTTRLGHGSARCSTARAPRHAEERLKDVSAEGDGARVNGRPCGYASAGCWDLLAAVCWPHLPPVPLLPCEVAGTDTPPAGKHGRRAATCRNSSHTWRIADPIYTDVFIFADLLGWFFKE